MMQLILETGKLTAIQSKLSKSAAQLLSKHAIIRTAVLQNEMFQLESSPKNRLSPQSLTDPIHSRLHQIIQYPTSRLHLAGQRVVLGMTGGSMTGVGVGWAGWLGLLLGNGEGVISSLGLNASTTIGVGMLIAVASIRWGVASWEKAKKRWWQDWKRVGEGLERDLKVNSLHPILLNESLISLAREHLIGHCINRSQWWLQRPATAFRPQSKSARRSWRSLGKNLTFCTRR